MALLDIRNVTRRFGDFVAVDDVSLAIGAGEFFTLLGPSGCGKTTLLRMIAGFDRPDSGSIVLDGRDVAGVPPEDRDVHTVFQSYALFPHLSVADNVGYGLDVAGVARRERQARVAEALALVGLGELGRRRPRQLSGGQQQRVALARALVNRPRLLLLDEPLSALDRHLRQAMQIELKALQHQVGITFLVVTHDQEEALVMSDRIAVMAGGSLQQVGDPGEIYDRPANRFVAGFIGNNNLLAMRVQGRSGDHLIVATDNGLQLLAHHAGFCPGDRVDALLRPEQLRIEDEVQAHTASFEGTVESSVFAGPDRHLRVVTQTGERFTVLLRHDPRQAWPAQSPGQQVRLSYAPEAVHLMAGTGS
jgi:spermidine/putrescine transport system ATP-binding protein